MRAYIFGAVAIALFASHVRRMVDLAGLLRTVTPMGTEACRKIQGPDDDFYNCEDVVFGSEPGTLYAACDTARNKVNMVMDIHHPMAEDEPGQVWRIDYRNDTVTKLGSPGGDFHPLGITLVNPTLLMVISLNHHSPASIELLRLPDLKLIRTIRHPNIHTPNGLHVLEGHDAPDGTPSFFFTNDHGYVTGIPKKIENFVGVPLGSVMFYDARTEQAYPVARNLWFPNGLAGDHKHTLFLAESSRKLVRKYEIAVDGESKVQLRQIDQASFPMAVDNIHYDASTGDVVAAGHPRVIDLLIDLRKPDNAITAGSQVSIWHTRNGTVRTVFADDGQYYRTSSSALVDYDRNSLVISGLYERGILVCKQQ